MTTKPCCMCGSVSSKRCSGCTKFGFDLFFCSEEHQRLFWPSHRRVCGKNAQPFLFPLLSDEEADDVLQGPIAIIELVVADSLRAQPEDILDLVNRLRSSNVVRPFDDLEAIQPGLRNIRAIRYRYRNPFASDTFQSAGELASKLGTLSGTSSFDLLASDILREDCLRHPNDSEHWWTPLMHKWLAAEHTALLLSLDSSGDIKSTEIYKLAKWTAGECFKFVADEVRPVNTLVAEKLLRRFGQLCTEYYLNVV